MFGQAWVDVDRNGCVTRNELTTEQRTAFANDP
ncbi:MAG TPA: HNH endonuclease, partial [Arthrobacter bacterium]|nr:HNH endonuclease [Arthrobacter sp.]